MQYTFYESPLGEILLVGSERSLQGLLLPKVSGRNLPDPAWEHRSRTFHEAISQLAEYFDGSLQRFALPLRRSGTPFQQQVLQELAKIPYGTTCSYGQIARRVGKPRAVRAVGAANGRNPIPIILPCHRVIGANGQLTGYAGGLAIKAKLLELEQSHCLALS